MKILAFDTSTETLSAALGVGLGGRVAQVWSHDGPGGGQASATLIPMLMQLLDRAGLTLRQLDAIAFGRGPGSFTGLRTACAVAQGLAWGADRPLLPIDTLLAVAEDARHTHGAQRVVAALDARMDEVYTAAWDFSAGAAPRADSEPELVSPEALQAGEGWVLAGNVTGPYGERLAQPCLPALPTAEALLRLAPALIAAGHTVQADQALPLYLRDKVALTTAEREAKKSMVATACLVAGPPQGEAAPSGGSAPRAAGSVGAS